MKKTSTSKSKTGGNCPVSPFETVPADEAGQISEIAELTVKLQEIRARQDASQNGKRLRGVHAKSHGCVKATFIIDCNIADEYRVGLFADPGRIYEAWIRFSNAAVLREDDLKPNDKGVRQNGSRGMAIKVMDVDGDMLGADNSRRNQDFLMINTPEFAFANVRDYLRLDRILELDQMGADPKAYFFPAALAQLGKPKEGEPAEVTGARQFLQAEIANNEFLNKLTVEDLSGTFASARVAGEIAKQVVRNPMQVQYFGAAPFLFGPGQAMKFSAAPCKSVNQVPFNEITATSPSKDYLREALGESMAGCEDVCFDFMIQTRGVDADGLSIEDATTTWPEEKDSYVSVAKITIEAPQEPHSADVLEHCEKLAFSPWHCLAAHQPIGGINRLRKKVYADSAKHRSADWS